MATGGIMTKHHSQVFTDQIKQLEIEGAKLMSATSNLGGKISYSSHTQLKFYSEW